MKIEIVEGGVRLVPEKVTLGGRHPRAQPERFITYTDPDQGPAASTSRSPACKVVPEGLQIAGEASDVPLQTESCPG